MEGAKPHVNLDYRRALGAVAREPPLGLGFTEEILVMQFSDASLVADLLKCTQVPLNMQCALLAVWPARKELYTAMERNARSLGVSFNMDWVKPLWEEQPVRPTDGLQEGRRTQELANLLARGVKEGSRTIQLSDGRSFLATPMLDGLATEEGQARLPVAPVSTPAVVTAPPGPAIQTPDAPVRPPLEQTPDTAPATNVFPLSFERLPPGEKHCGFPKELSFDRFNKRGG